MIGLDDSVDDMGVIPSALSWLYQLIDQQKQRTGARFSVRVSAVELTGRQEALRDLLSTTSTSQSPGMHVQSPDWSQICIDSRVCWTGRAGSRAPTF